MARLGRFLDGLYRASAWIAGGLLVVMALLVLGGILARALGTYAGGLSEYSGYAMAAGSFFAFAYTFRSGGHIRVVLVLANLSAGRRRAFELWCLGAALAVSAYLAFYLCRLAYDSWHWEERSEGADAILLWIPQTPVALGAILLAVAVLHTFLEVLLDPTRSTAEGAEAAAPPEV